MISSYSSIAPCARIAVATLCACSIPTLSSMSPCSMKVWSVSAHKEGTAYGGEVPDHRLVDHVVVDLGGRGIRKEQMRQVRLLDLDPSVLHFADGSTDHVGVEVDAVRVEGRLGGVRAGEGGLGGVQVQRHRGFRDDPALVVRDGMLGRREERSFAGVGSARVEESEETNGSVMGYSARMELGGGVTPETARPERRAR